MGFLVFLFAHQNTSAVPGAEVTVNPYRDRDVFAAIVAALQATSEFSDVSLQPVESFANIPADRTPMALVIPRQWQEDPDTAPGSSIRRVGYLLSLAVRLDDPQDQYQALDRLAAIVQNTLDGSSLGGLCLGPMSRIRQGSFDTKSRHPELRVNLDAEFSYAIPASAARNVTR